MFTTESQPGASTIRERKSDRRNVSNQSFLHRSVGTENHFGTRAREFFGELANFADLMPGIEGIRSESGSIALESARRGAGYWLSPG